MKQDFIFEQEKDSHKKQNKQEVIEFILNQDYGTALNNEDLSKMLGYNLEDEEEYHKFKTMMSGIKKFLLTKGRILKSIPKFGYYILKPSQASNYCYRTYISKSARLYDKSKFVLEKIDKTKLNDVRLEEISNILKMNNDLIENSWKTIRESVYYSRKEYYDNLKD